MIQLLDRLPYFSCPKVVEAGGESFEIRRDQIVCWVCLTPSHVTQWDERFRRHRFPTLIDLGHGHNFTLHGEHLKSWSGLKTSELIALGSVAINGRHVPLFDAVVWMFPNLPGSMDIDPDRLPARIDLDEGISVVAGRSFPRIPLFGLRPFQLNGLTLTVEGATQRVWLTMPGGVESGTR